MTGGFGCGNDDCSGSTETLFESALFGHERDAFT
jgi:transcriptional regulator with GAF, ATPase, and Fis domain